MRIIRPVAITDAILISSTVAEVDHAAYNAGTTYTIGQRVIVTTGDHSIYESLQNANTGNAPATSLTWWLKISATNRWKAFDSKIADQVSNTTSINYVFAPATGIDAISLLNMDATSINITITDPTDGEVYNVTTDLVSTENVIDGYTYCFEPILQRTDIALFDIPPYPAASISITVTYAGSTAKLGEIVIGKATRLGFTEYNPSISIIDYSRKEADTFGNYVVVQRTYSKRMSCSLFLDNGYVDEVVRQLSLYRATPLVWVGADDFSSLIVYGFYRSFDVTIPYPTQSACSLEIEGLT